MERAAHSVQRNVKLDCFEKWVVFLLFMIAFGCAALEYVGIPFIIYAANNRLTQLHANVSSSNATNVTTNF